MRFAGKLDEGYDVWLDEAPRRERGDTWGANVTSERTADADAIRKGLYLYVPDGFRDDDGVWHDGPHRLALLAALDRLVARNQQLQEALTAAHRLEDSDGQATHYLIYDPACPHCQRHDELRAALASVRAGTPA